MEIFWKFFIFLIFSNLISIIKKNNGKQDRKGVFVCMFIYRNHWLTEISLADIKKHTVEIPQDVWYIDRHAFQKPGIKQIVIPKNVRKLNNFAFRACKDLEEIVIENEECKLGASVFSACTKLRQIELPKNLKVIPTCTFDFCESLERIKLPSTVETIGEYAFCACKNLKWITIPDSVPYIREQYFRYCENLTDIHFHGKVYSYNDLLAYRKIS